MLEESERESGRTWSTVTIRIRGIGELLPLPRDGKPTAEVPWLRGRDHNLYNGLAKVYPESRFCEETGRRMGVGENRPFP